MNVAVVGLGAMGSRIAARLLDHGHDVVVWNRDPERSRLLVERGATAADSPRAAAEQAEATITMVTDPEALRAVTEGDDGVLAGLAESRFLVQMSTVSPEATERLAGVAGERLLDSPVRGSIGEVRSRNARDLRRGLG